MSDVQWAGPVSDDVSGETAGWPMTGTFAFHEDATNAHGADAWVVRAQGDGATAAPTWKSTRIPVAANDLVELQGWVSRQAGTAGIASLHLLSYDDADVETERLALTASPDVGAWSELAKQRWLVDTGTVAVAFAFRLDGTPAATEDHYFDDVVLTVLPSGPLRVIATGTIELTGADGSSSTAVASETENIPIDLGYAPAFLLYEGTADVAVPWDKAGFTSTGDVAYLRYSLLVYNSALQRLELTVSYQSWYDASGETYTVRYFILAERVAT